MSTFLVVSIIKAAVVAFVLLTALAYLQWLERKVLAHIQLRVGPRRVGPHGLLQPLADVIKLITKEDMMPSHVNKVFEEIRKTVHGYGVSPALLAIGPVPTMPLNGRVAALPGAIQSSGDTLFTSGSLTPYSEILNKVMESPGKLYSGQGQ